MSLTLVSAPAVEPLVVADILAQSRMSGSEEAGLIASYIRTARAAAEAFLRRRLITQTVRLTLTGFCPMIRLPVAPIQSVAQVAYTGADGAEVILDAARYRLVTSVSPAHLVPVYGGEWPVPRADFDSVRIDLVVGYGASGSAVPEDILQGMRLLVAHYLARRESAAEAMSELPFGTRDLWLPHILWL